MALLISVMDVVISGIFTALVARQWLQRRRPHQLLWAVALAIWTGAVSAEAIAAYNGVWSPTTYRAYYLFGALMVAPWLGAGSLFLIVSRRTAAGFLIAVVVLTFVGGTAIVTYPIEPAVLTQTDVLGFVDVSVFPFIPTRMLIVIGNIAGTVAFVGSALYSVYQFWRQRIQRKRMVGVLLIGAGGLVAAVAHSIGVLGGPGLFRISELTAIVLIFAGYLISTRPTRQHIPTTAHNQE